GVHGHLDVRELYPRAVRLDPDFHIEIHHALDRHEDLHISNSPAYSFDRMTLLASTQAASATVNRGTICLSSRTNPAWAKILRTCERATYAHVFGKSIIRLAGC